MTQIPTLGNNGYHLQQQSLPQSHDFTVSPTMVLSPPLTNNNDPLPQPPSKDNCDRRRPQEQDMSRFVKMPEALIGKAVSPYLKQHIPSIYAPIDKLIHQADADVPTKDPNTKFCYRHRPDSKCRRAADESKMDAIQRELNSMSAADQQAITHVWSLFSAAPAKHRDLMLQGIITQCCFPQLSIVSREVQAQLKIDFLTALPTELSYKVLCFLDTVSLCKAAQVSRRWHDLADDDLVWHHMCEQHINQKCTKCGWGLPLLEKRKLKAWSHHIKSHQRSWGVQEAEGEPAQNPSEDSSKRQIVVHEDGPSKRPRLNGSSSSHSQVDAERKFRPWKDVYRDRFKVGAAWKNGRCSIRTFKGHENGVTCLQFDDNILVSGSYDCTIKVWKIQSGQILHTLRGHTSTIRALQFDDSKLVSSSLDGNIKIWSLSSGECLSTLQCHTDGVLSVHFEGSTLCSSSIDRTVKVFNFNTKQTFSLRGHTDWVNHVRLDAPSRTVFSASDDLSIKVWDLDSKQCIKTFLGHVGQVQQVLLMPADFEPDEMPGSDNIETGSFHSSRSVTPTPPDRAAYGPAFVADPERPLPPRYILSGGLDNTLRLWEVSSGKCLRSMFGHVEGIWAVAGDSLRVVSGANDSMTKIWDPRSGKCERSFTGHAGPVTCVGLSDSRMASGSEDGEVRLYSFEGEAMEERGTPS